MSQWEEIANETIGEAIQNCGDGDYKKAIDAAYPFGERKYHPYKVWLKCRKMAFVELGIVKYEPKKSKKEIEYEKSLQKSVLFS